MDIATDIARAGLVAVIVAIAGIVLLGLLTGRIETRGMLATTAGGPADPERILLLVATAGFAAAYAVEALSGTTRGNLPDVDPQMASLLGATNILFIGGKLVRRGGTGP